MISSTDTKSSACWTSSPKYIVYYKQLLHQIDITIVNMYISNKIPFKKKHQQPLVPSPSTTPYVPYRKKKTRKPKRKTTFPLFFLRKTKKNKKKNKQKYIFKKKKNGAKSWTIRADRTVQARCHAEGVGRGAAEGRRRQGTCDTAVGRHFPCGAGGHSVCFGCCIFVFYIFFSYRVEAFEASLIEQLGLKKSMELNWKLFASAKAPSSCIPLSAT